MKPGYHDIYTRYRDNITRGVLKPGDKVPAIRVLADSRAEFSGNLALRWAF